MNLCSYHDGDAIRLGAVSGEWVVDLNRAGLEMAQADDTLIPPCMRRFLEGGAQAMEAARSVLQRAEGALRDSGQREALAQKSIVKALKDVRLAPPVPHPGKIICIGKNYAEHAAELGGKRPTLPEIFVRFASTLVAPGAPVYRPLETEQWDYEAELAIIIGKKGRRIAIENALDYAAGYTCFNDISARDYQMRISQWTAGKNFDHSGPMGPYLVTADEVGDPQSLDIRLDIDGETMQSSNTGNMVFGVAYLISHLSEFTTLEPGDVIATGTPGGVGMARKPPRFLRPGETVRVVIARVGVLENPVLAEKAQPRQ